LGSRAKWFLGEGFNLLGDLALAFQYGIFDVKYQDRMSVLPSNHVKLTSQSHQVAPVAEYSIGIGWGRYVNNCKQFVDFSLLYEGEYWFRQNQTLVVFDAGVSRLENASEDISLHGATFCLQVNF
ncbi:MAG: hypothetical protein HY860_03145, partial [Chlamydiales bacterium]|nr:hypothetical protein [Chlamydiales bacterium]